MSVTRVTRQGNLGTRNLVINGAMNISQRGQNTAIATGFDSTTNTYGPDRFLMSGYGSPQNRGDVEHVSSGGPTGFPSFFRYDITTAESAVAAGEATLMQHRIEGYLVNELSWGNAAAKPVTLSFYMRSPKSGTHCVALGQSGGRHQIKEFTVSSADTWENHSVTFSADTSGSMNATTSEGLRIIWPIICGSTYQASADTWAGATDFATSNQQNLADNTSNNIDLTGVQLEVGPVASDFVHEDYATTFNKCLRYFEYQPYVVNTFVAIGFSNTTTSHQCTLQFTEKRASGPTIAVSTAAQWEVNRQGTDQTCSSLSGSSASRVGMTFIGIVSSGLPVGEAAAIRSNNSGNYVSISSEL